MKPGDENGAEPLHSAEPDPLLAWFLGPKSENAEFLESLLLKVLRDYAHWRQNYFPADQTILSRSRARGLDPVFDDLETKTSEMMAELRRNFPFYSPRYIAHQLSDTTLASIIGHFAGLLFNPNNVTPEAAPVTVHWELDACAALLRMLGYQPPPEPPTSAEERQSYSARLKAGFGWAHMTSGGTTANIEALWAARAIAYFPLAVRDIAIALALNLDIKLPNRIVGEPDRVMQIAAQDLDEYRLLMMRPNEKIYLLARLVEAVAIKESLDPQSAAARVTQLLGESSRGLARGFAAVSADYPPVIVAPATAHYSIAKAADVLGIGRANVTYVSTDASFRMDVADLEHVLRECVRDRRVPVAVIAVLGTTEEGAIDPVHEIDDVRARLEEELGASFWLHIDAAYGGYFRSVVNLSDRNQLQLVAGRLGRLAGVSLGEDPDTWTDCVISRLRATIDRRTAGVEKERLSELVSGCSDGRGPKHALASLRAAAVLASQMLEAEMVGSLNNAVSDYPGAQEEVPAWPAGLRDREIDPKLVDWVSLLQAHLGDNLAIEHGSYRRNLRIAYGDQQIFSALLATPRAESITVDPHKMGYIGYACGVVAFKNDRVRHFLTQDAPYITTAEHNALVHKPPRHQKGGELVDDEPLISVDAFAPFTLEGSRAGASATALWLSTEVTPPTLEGHGRIVRASALAARELYEWLKRWPVIARQNGVDPEYDLVPYSATPPDTNIVVFGVKRKTAGTLSALNAVTNAVYHDFAIQPELGDRDYSYGQAFFLSHTVFQSSTYRYQSVAPILERAQLKSTARDYEREGLCVLRASVMNPYITELRQSGRQQVVRDFMVDLHKSASNAAQNLGV